MKKETLEQVDWQIRQLILEINHDYINNNINGSTLEKSYKLITCIQKHLNWNEEKEK